MKKLLRIGVHFMFWLGVMLFYTYYFGYNSNDFGYVVRFVGFLLPVTAGTSYYVSYILIPKYFIPKRYFKFALYTIYTLVISSYFIVISVFLALVLLADNSITNMAPLSKNFVFIFIGVYLVVILTSTIKLLKYNNDQMKRNSALNHQILAAQLEFKEQELKYLKNQIHPHFLFNMLNTLYGMSLKNDYRAPDTILKLASLLDYILYRVTDPHVNVRKEVEHLNDYIDLERIRFGSNLEVDINCFINEDLQIAPMLLIPFIENCFKHGGLKNGILKIKGQVSSDNGNLSLIIKNTKQKYPAATQHGIGIKNITRRLELLYKNRYKLDFHESEEWFEVTLEIKTIEPHVQ